MLPFRAPKASFFLQRYSKITVLYVSRGVYGLTERRTPTAPLQALRGEVPALLYW